MVMLPDYRILITGSRHWSDTAIIEKAILAAVEDRPASTVVVVHGAAPGADTLAAEVAEKYGFRVEAHPAEWEKFGRAAGPTRNRVMVRRGADMCLAFPTQGSRGTYDTVRRATAAGIPVRTFKGS